MIILPTSEAVVPVVVAQVVVAMMPRGVPMVAQVVVAVTTAQSAGDVHSHATTWVTTVEPVEVRIFQSNLI